MIQREVALITGGSGFLAQHLSPREIQNKKSDLFQEIRLLDLVPYEPIFEDVLYALNGVTIVFHLCSEKYCFDMFDDKEKQWRNNYATTETLLEAALEKNVPIVINVGHAMSHVSWSESVLMPAEVRTLNPPDTYLLGHYGESKFASEQLVLKSNGRLMENGEKLLTSSIRPPMLYGEGENWLIPYSLDLAKKIGGTIPQLSDRDEKIQMMYAGNCASILTRTAECLRQRPEFGGEVFFCNDGNGLRDFLKLRVHPDYFLYFKLNI